MASPAEPSTRTPDEEPRPATRGEIIAKLNLVPVFSVSDNDTQSICATKVGNVPCGTWFADIRDAEKLLVTLRKHNPSMNLGIEATPLGHALALSERWVPAAAKLTTRIQASTYELESLPGFPQLPDELKKAFSPLTSRFPVWVCEDLHTATDMPFFLHGDDLKDAWFAKTGKSLDEAKELDVTDLRVLVAKMCCQPGTWGNMHLLPPKRTVEYMQRRKKQMEEDGDLPPPLAETSEAEEAPEVAPSPDLEPAPSSGQSRPRSERGDSKGPAEADSSEEIPASAPLGLSAGKAGLLMTIAVVLLALAVAIMRGGQGEVVEEPLSSIDGSEEVE